MAQTHASIGDAIAGEAPCDGCPNQQLCRTTEVACKAFSKYVSTGTWSDDDRGNPVRKWFRWALMQ